MGTIRYEGMNIGQSKMHLLATDMHWKGIEVMLLQVFLTFAGNALAQTDLALTKHKYACVSPDSCQTHYYSVECAVDSRIAMLGVNYGAKAYTTFCPKTESCVSKQLCCKYQAGDCLVPYSEAKLASVYGQCSQQPQCGWFFAEAVKLEGDCRVRDKTNYVWTEYQCINVNKFIDACSQHTISGKSVQVHHSAISSDYNYKQCSCVITPETCNTTAKLQFRSVDVRLHNVGDNLTLCSSQSRVELIGQNDRKIYACEKDKFLHGFNTFHISHEKNMVLYLHRQQMHYPQNVWFEVKTTVSEVGVRVTCGPRSVETAKRCAAEPVTTVNTLDIVNTLPDRISKKPTVIHLSPGDLDPNDVNRGNNPDEDQNPALAVIIGGIVAGVVMLILILLVVCFIIRKKRRDRTKHGGPVPKYSLPVTGETHVNYYEPISDAETKSTVSSPLDPKQHHYHQPWGQQQGVPVQNRAKPSELAYATSEEIKVLIEKMEKDRQSIVEGGSTDYYPSPDPTYYRHVSTFTFKPERDCTDGANELKETQEHESETESTGSNNCGTDKVGSEDSKVEADRDRGIEDSDVESHPGHQAESDRGASYYDGYESPRVSSFNPSDASESVRNSNRSSIRSDNHSELQNYVYHPDAVIFEDNLSDIDVPEEHAPPVTEALKNQSDSSKSSHVQSDEQITLGGYREPRGSIDSGIREATPTSDNTDDKSDHPYSPVYDEIADQHTKL